MEQLATVYYSIVTSLKAAYGTTSVFQIVERAYQDHFKIVEEDQITVVQVRPSTELGCQTLQSPDDVEATFRKKRTEHYQGYSAFGVETCDPENKLNLITLLSVHPNQTDDAAILAEDLPKMVEKTSDLKECHLDGGFGSTAVDIIAQKEEVNIIQTAVKGNLAKVPIEVQGNEDTGFIVTCPHPKQDPVRGIKLKKAYKANFNLTKCKACPFQQDCPAYKNRVPKKEIAVFRFNPDIVLRQKRHKAIAKIPQERRTLRNGVENLMGRMHRCEKHTGKLKIRGLFNCKLYVFAMGISINFERIFRSF